MTNNNSRRPRCIDCSRVLNSTNATIDTSIVGRMCNDCYDYASWENTHQDEGHDADTDRDLITDCPVCNGEAPTDRSKPSNVVKAHANRSHADCYDNDLHPMTKEGRADCRKGKFHNA
jgi:hypothetical protein